MTIKEKEKKPTAFFFLLFLFFSPAKATPLVLVSFSFFFFLFLFSFFFREGSKSHARYERSNKDPPRKLGSLLRGGMPVDVFRMQETQTISICVVASCELASKTKISRCKQAHRQTAVMPHYIVVASASLV